MDIIEEMQQLIEKISIASYQYYVLDNPTMSDKEWDKLYDRLQELEKTSGIVLPSSPSNKIGGNPLSGFKKVKHLKKLMSLQKAQTFDEIVDWLDRNKKLVSFDDEFTVEHKFDGLSLALTYENGKLVLGATRGNGEIGEDVTEQVKTIRTVPLSINYKGKVIVQGEGIMKLSELEKYNRHAEEKLKNARNAAAGAIRNLDPKATKSRNLDFFAYNVNYIEGKEFKTHGESHQFLVDNGFMVDPLFKIVKSLDEVKEIIEKVDKEKSTYDFLIDGIVIKLNNIKARDELGETIKFPRGMIAYKFEALETTTILEDVIWQVSRTGKLTPVGILEPIELAGVTVSRATLNNYSEIKKKKVKINSRVFVRRSNEVIPEILGLAEDTKDSVEVTRPDFCPSCGHAVIKEDIETICPNHFNCEKQIIGRLSFFASRHAMDIVGFSTKTIEKLYELYHINTFSDIYKLTDEQLYNIDAFKDKKVNLVLSSIEKSKNPDLYRFIFALGIENVGIKTARQLANHFKTFENLKNATVSELVNLPDIALITATGIVNFFKDENNIEELKRLAEVGVKPKENIAAEVSEGFFTNKKVVLTGTLQSMTRQEASELIESFGGETATSVSKNTDYVVYGSEAGSKLTKAIALNIKTLNEEEFLALVKK